MYKRLTSSRLRVELASPAYVGLGIIKKIMYKSLTDSSIRVELASTAYVGLGIIQKIILLSINVRRASEYGWNSHPPPAWA